MKTCRKCSNFKEFSDFYKRGKSYRSNCKSCEYEISLSRKEYFKEYQKENKDKIKEYYSKYKANNKEYINNYHSNYRIVNKDKIKEYQVNYFIDNKEEIIDKRREYQKSYRDDNRDILKDNYNSYRRNRKKTDTIYRISESVRSIISLSLSNNGYRKTSKTCEILGCSFDEFKTYIESKFEPCMTWENKGLYNGELNHGWDIDHIVPISSASIEEEILKLNHYTNLQPLCSKVNRDIKRNKHDYDKEVQ